MCFNIFGGGGGNRAAEKEAQRQADIKTAEANTKATKLRQGMVAVDDAFGAFNDDYFTKLSQDYMDYAGPQLQDQYDNAKKQIMFALARKGSLNSTVKGDELARLDKENATNIIGLRGVGDNYANNARRDVQSNKGEVVSQLNQTFDSDAAVSDALSRAKVIAAGPQFSPLTQMFTDISAAAATSARASDLNPQNSPNYGARNFGYGSNGYKVG